MRHRGLFLVILLAAGLHLVGIARTKLPAQDGLKFLRVAKQFGRQPPSDVIRGSDQHPLYPAAIALVHPAIARVVGRGPDSWRITAQGVSVLASLLTMVPLYHVTRRSFGPSAALLSLLLYAALPNLAEIGRDTLSDSLALTCFAAAFAAGAEFTRTRHLGPGLLCGLASGAGFWTRPEMAVFPISLAALEGLRLLKSVRHVRSTGFDSLRRVLVPAAPLLVFLIIVGGYTITKEEVSEKLAMRLGVASVPATGPANPHRAAWMPRGLDSPRWDFSAKEESGRHLEIGPTGALGRVVTNWAEGLGFVFAPAALWGAFRFRKRHLGSLSLAYAILFGAVLTRHAMVLGYLSGRHVLTLILVSLPWTAAGLMDVGRRLALQRRGSTAIPRAWKVACTALLVTASLVLQAEPAHASRWGHWAAGRWLAEHAAAGDAVLDTRGWAAFVSGLPAYDYWHVGQALSDSRLSYVVVGEDELNAGSRRAETLKALLDRAGEPAAAYPGREGAPGIAVRVFRFRHPENWEGLTR